MKIFEGELIINNHKQFNQKSNHMNTTATLQQLKDLKLSGMVRSYESVLQLSTHQQPEAHTMLAQLCDAEQQNRIHCKTLFYLKLSKLRYAAMLEEISFSKDRNLPREQVHQLADCSYIDRAENILISGSTGSGEDNQIWHEGRGVAAVISPWNFPLAICCGMTVAALVTGNTVIVKPAEQTPGVAMRLCRMLWEAGIPREVLQLLPGRGEIVGAALVRHPQVATIAFTGSKAVGLDILRAAGETPEGQGFIKRVICEMGGKNAIIVDPSADIDEAVLGVRQSAFGYTGQKCSACSRVIVLEENYDLFLRRLIEATRALVVGDPLLPGTDLGPLIDLEAAEKVRGYIDLGKQEARLELAVEAPAEGAFVGPHLFSVERGGTPRIAVEEIFGPVLTVIRARNLDEALSIANSSSYRLTGGLFSRTPSTLERVRREFRVGNLYLNRGITGALVGRQPFGGFGLSGVGCKAGGADYLRQFVDPRLCTENTMRRGFAPPAD